MTQELLEVLYKGEGYVGMPKSIERDPIVHSKWFFPPDVQRTWTSPPKGVDVMDTRWNTPQLKFF